MKFYKTKEFKDLNDKWEQKLKKSGFVDIEHTKSQELKLHHSSWFYFKYGIHGFKGKEAYYQCATEFYHEHKFLSEPHKKIWFKHSEGWILKDIAIKHKMSLPNAARIIRFYRKLMKEWINEYSSKGLPDN